MKRRTRRPLRTVTGIFGGWARIWPVVSCRPSIEMSRSGWAQKDGVSTSTVNRTLALCCGRSLRACQRLGMGIERASKVRLIAEPKGRVRYLTQGEARRLLVAMPDHLAAMASFRCVDRLRQRNVRELRWSKSGREQPIG
jgi:hypothetical protein